MNIPNTLRIGSLTFDSPFIQGPLAGYTCSAMRRLPWRYGGLAFTVTEMLSAHQMAYDQDRSPRYTHIANDEGPVCFQLSGNDPTLLGKACERAQAHGATLLDFNVGCPQPKIRKKGHGSALLSDSKQLSLLLKTMKSHSDLPITAKIRIDHNSTDSHNMAVLDAAHHADIDALVVHGRHWKEKYDTPACHDSIAWFVEKADIPVIGNGDLVTRDDMIRFFEHTKAAGAMVARASLGRPWLFTSYYRDIAITAKEQWQCFIDHIEALIELEGNEIPALNQARGFLKYYFPESSEEARSLFFQQPDLAAIKKIKHLF